jgi:hypothetical protein
MTNRADAPTGITLKPGLRLRSQVCDTEVIVVRAPSEPLDLRCGGTPMIDIAAEVREGGRPAAGFTDGNQLGKRYTLEGYDQLELLVTRAGEGALSIGNSRLIVKEAKPLPSSD